jgi:pimeloyl-ACP methyl ester carboxylesterase
LLVAGCGHDRAQTARAPARSAGFVTANGHRLYYECTGSGKPTVLLEAGLGADSSSWQLVQPLVARTTRVCAYDRAGTGRSPAAAATRTGRDEVVDVAALIRAAHVPTPLVVAGHSFGGLLAQELSASRPRAVAGLVLVDSTNADQSAAFLGALGEPRHGESPLRQELRTFLTQNPPNAEGVDMRRTFAELPNWGLGRKPLIVITAGEETSPQLPPALKRLLGVTWLRLQADLARRSTNAIHVVAAWSPHAVISALGQPRLVARAIDAVVGAVRRGSPLPSCATLFRRPAARCVSPT